MYPTNRPTNAAEILKLYWDGQFPVQPEVIARQMGAEVYSDLHDRSGEIAYLHDNRIVIRCNGYEAPVRQRFTLAHEIGHWARGHLSHGIRMFRDDDNSFYSQVNRYEEREANQFAAELLMPSDAVVWAMESGNWHNFDDLARAFGVSGAAMGYRLQNLGLV